MKNINAVNWVLAHIAPDLNEGRRNITWEKKKSLFKLMPKNLSFNIKKNKYGTIREIKGKISLTVSLLSTNKKWGKRCFNWQKYMGA